MSDLLERLKEEREQHRTWCEPEYGIWECEFCAEETGANERCTNATFLDTAIAMLELHQPGTPYETMDGRVVRCKDCGWYYPCPTAQAAEKGWLR